MTTTTTTPPALVLAGHGSRDLVGVADAHALLALVRDRLPDVRVDAGFVELTPPTIVEAVDAALDDGAPSVVVVPIMVGAGGHVRDDIPSAIDQATASRADATVVRTRHLGSPGPLLAAIRERIAASAPDADPATLTVVMVGRGCSVPEANADHARLCRLIEETGGYARVVPAFIQVSSPSLPEALDLAVAGGATQIVIMPHFLFPGRLRTWTRDQAEAWSATHPGTPLSVADVIGACDQLADVVVTRYREGALKARTALGSPAYLTGLLLAGRQVVVVGGGCVARRRVPRLLHAGARVVVVDPAPCAELRRLAAAGSIAWLDRPFAESDLDGAWYVLATTDDAAVNQAVAAAAEARHTFCVRADDAIHGSAWTPATGDTDGVSVAVVSSHDPARSKRLRDAVVGWIADDRPAGDTGR